MVPVGLWAYKTTDYFVKSSQVEAHNDKAALNNAVVRVVENAASQNAAIIALF